MNKRLISYSEEKNMDAIHARHKNTIAALNEVMKDVAFTRHRKTLDDIAKAMTRSIENEQKWSMRCQKLQAEIAAYESKVKTAVQLSEEDKDVIDTLRNELENAWKFIEELKQQGDSNFIRSLEGFNEVNTGVDSNQSVGETIEKIERLTEDKYKLFDEIEKGKLQIFELEEDLASKEKSVEELSKELNSKAKCLEKVRTENENLKNVLRENESLKVLLEESKKSNIDAESKIGQHTKTESETKSVSCQTLHSLKRQLQDVNRKEQLSMEKLKHLMKKNKVLSRTLYKVKNQNDLMKLQLKDQTRMLNLLSCQCCKLEENDKKQVRTINDLECIRNKHVHQVGHLEQEIHTLKTEGIKNRTGHEKSKLATLFSKINE